ncbi:MAG TPA: hypothetical protein DCM67_06890, partial [Propionibacteriaceae bacterium]|nr:hypothetical protein [Propionibacteriaceae bacterium]
MWGGGADQTPSRHSGLPPQAGHRFGAPQRHQPGGPAASRSQSSQGDVCPGKEGWPQARRAICLPLLQHPEVPLPSRPCSH